MKPSPAKSKIASQAVARAMAAFGAHAKITQKKRKSLAALRIKVSRWVKPRFDISVKPAPQENL
jgi:hypothetical protein